jgi:hypothetical protein
MQEFRIVTPLKVQIALLCILTNMLCHAQQSSHSLSCDVGRSPLAEGVYVKPALQTQYVLGDYAASMGFQWTFSRADRKNFSGWQASIGKEYRIREFPVSVTLFTLINPYSDLLREVNFGFLLGHQRDHLLVRFGNASRVYGLKKKAFAATGIDPDPSLRIIEYRNFTYRFVGYLNKMDREWNIGTGISNMDHFRVQQETNPMLMITGYKRILPELTVNTDMVLQNAGMSNLSAEIYGFYGRIGITWKPGSTSHN